jgi:hypothetical protein
MTKDEIARIAEAITKITEGLSDEQFDEVMQVVRPPRREDGFIRMREKSLELKQRIDESRACFQEAHNKTKELLRQHRERLTGQHQDRSDKERE